MRFPPSSSTTAVPPAPARRKRRKGPLILLLLFLVCYIAFSLIEGRLNGMVTTTFDLNKSIRDLLGGGSQSGTAGTPVAAPGGSTPEQQPGGAQAGGGQQQPGGGGNGGRVPAGGGQVGNGGGGAAGTTPGNAPTAGGGNGAAAPTGGTATPGATPAGGTVGNGGQVGPGEGGTAGGVEGGAGGGVGAPTGAAPSPAAPHGGGGQGGGTDTGGTPVTPPGQSGSTVTVQLFDRAGHELNPRFHFQDGTARLMIDERHFTPGFYTLRVTRTDLATGASETAEQEFAWGVLAMNTDKDRYRQNETSRIDFGVLDEEGRIVCDAHLTLAITLPDGTREELSTAGGGIRVTGTCGRKEGGLLSPDYEADLPLPLVGDYQLELTAVRPDATAHATSTITSTLKVVTAPPYIVRRTAATRLWPFAPSTMDIDVAFEQDFTGTITDVVPQGFSVTSATPTASIGTFPGGNDTGVAWTGSWHAGETAHLHYVYDAPDISPQFFLVGPLQMDGAAGHDEELRSWEIANDDAGASATYRITSDVFPGGGAETARSTNYILSDTIGEPIVGPGASATYALNSGYRQTTQPALPSLGMGCTPTTNLGTIVFSGQQTGSGTCTVTTDNAAGYSLAWTTSPQSTNGLVGYWKFDETTGTTAYDDSGNGNNGTLTNGPTISTSVPSTYFSTRSLSLDGVNDYVELTSIAGNLPQGSTSRAIAGWFKPNSVSQQSFFDYGTDAAGRRVSITADTTELSVAVNGHRYGKSGLSLSGWHHITVVFPAGATTSTQWLIYLDGVPQTLGSLAGASQTVNTGNTYAHIGLDSSTTYYNGNIDDVRIYSRALSYAEIQDLASKAPPGALVASGSQLNHIPPYSLPATGGLVGHWRMDERTAGSTVADSSGKGNDGTPNGAGGANNLPQPSTDVPSGTNFRDSKSLSFDGTDDYVAVGNPSSLNISGNKISMAAWVKLVATPTSGDGFGTIATKTNSYYFQINNARKLAVYQYGTSPPGYHASSTTLNLNTWYHVAYTYDGSAVRLFINGTLDQSVAVTGNISTDSYQLGLGANLDLQGVPLPGYQRYFPGLLDDVRIYNRALTAGEIKALYNTPQTWNVTATGAGFGARLRSSSTDTDAKWGTDSSSDKWLNVGDGNYEVVRRTSATATGGSLETFQYRAEVGVSKIQPTGLYQTTVTYTASAL